MVRRNPVPDVAVTRTIWHPQPNRRVAVLELGDGSAPLELREGDAVGPLVLVEISPIGVIFLHDGVEIQRRVSARLWPGS